MKPKRITILALIACTCLVMLVAMASAQQLPPRSWTDERAVDWTATGGGYHLTSLSWPRSTAMTEANAIAIGGRYRMLTPALRGDGCCCTYLPCLMNSVP